MFQPCSNEIIGKTFKFNELATSYWSQVDRPIMQNGEALKILKKHGAKVDGELVYFPRKMVEDALGKCPAKFKWQARNDENSVIAGQGFLVQACGGPVFIQDLEHGRRPGTLEDFANIQKLYQSSDVFDLVGYSPVDPSDVKPEERHIYTMYEIIKNTDKPVFGYVCGGKKAGKMLDIMEIAFGQEGVMQNSYVAAISVNLRSPLCWSEEQLDTLNEYARRNQIVSPAP